MGEKSETESEALPAGREAAQKDEAAGKPETPAGGSEAVTGSWRLMLAIGSWRLLFAAAALLILAVAAASASVALYWSSRSAYRGEQNAAFADLRQSLGRMERQIATSEARGTGGSAAGDRSPRSAPEKSGLLDAANLRYREGQFQEAAASFRAAMDMDLAGSFTDETHYRYAQSLMKTGKFDGALAEFQTVETGFPGSPYFASAAMETAQLLFQKKSYAQARRVLYELMAARDRLSAADKAGVERAYFFVARCYEAEAESLDTSLHPSPALATASTGRSADPIVSPAKAGSGPLLHNASTQTEGK
jgi:tetratricopeptide (TPR) repeat protein